LLYGRRISRKLPSSCAARLPLLARKLSCTAVVSPISRIATASAGNAASRCLLPCAAWRGRPVVRFTHFNIVTGSNTTPLSVNHMELIMMMFPTPRSGRIRSSRVRLHDFKMIGSEHEASPGDYYNMIHYKSNRSSDSHCEGKLDTLYRFKVLLVANLVAAVPAWRSSTTLCSVKSKL
jgi:hypothetical protein